MIKLDEIDFLSVRQKQIFRKHGLTTVLDILNLFPERIDNFLITNKENYKLNETITLVGKVTGFPTVKRIKQNMTIMFFPFEVQSEPIVVTIFNRHFFAPKVRINTSLRVRGKFDGNFTRFIASTIEFDKTEGELIPIFKINGISQENLQKIQQYVYTNYKEMIKDPFSSTFLKEQNLLSLSDTIKYLIKPSSLSEFEKAKERIKFQELLKYELDLSYLKYQRKNFPKGIKISVKDEVINNFIKNLSFVLTVDQRRVIDECLVDIRSNYKMNRLLQGEVGSGKTIVAAVLFLGIIREGFQGAIMAPTEVLANQHFDTFSQLFKNENINIGLLTSTTKNRETILEKTRSGKINLLIGTHALFQKDVGFSRLGLVVTDEEQRFGVRQRMRLVGKGYAIDHLKMTATPIPRTLAISKLGDNDISTIKTMPVGRKKVKTFFLNYDERKLALEHIFSELEKNHQIYIVVPAIEESSLEIANATETYEKVKAYFAKKATVGLIHGRLGKDEKEATMKDFVAGKINILIATSVIEVGVNVLNATTIVILDADRFGISQLHQMRGRVQRGSSESFCFLISRSNVDTAIKRLDLVSNCDDGFKLAEADLEQRGRGDLFGERQSGNVYFKLANLLADEDLLERAHETAEELINSGRFFTDEFKELFLEVDTDFKLKEKMIE